MISQYEPFMHEEMGVVLKNIKDIPGSINFSKRQPDIAYHLGEIIDYITKIIVSI